MINTISPTILPKSSAISVADDILLDFLSISGLEGPASVQTVVAARPAAAAATSPGQSNSNQPSFQRYAHSSLDHRYATITCVMDEA